MSQQSSSNNQQDVVVSNGNHTTPSEGFPRDRLNEVKTLVTELMNLRDWKIRFANSSVDTPYGTTKWESLNEHVGCADHSRGGISVWIDMRFKDSHKIPPVTIGFKKSEVTAWLEAQMLEDDDFSYGNGKWRAFKDLEFDKNTDHNNFLQLKIDVKIDG